MPGDSRLHQPRPGREKALENIREAIELCLENQEAEGWRLPMEFEIVRLAIPSS
jgi:predicted RNase H-like HicB family nuclease